VHREALYTTQVKIVRADREALSDPAVRGSNCRGRASLWYTIAIRLPYALYSEILLSV
jgi:hypothetical protein